MVLCWFSFKNVRFTINPIANLLIPKQLSDSKNTRYDELFHPTLDRNEIVVLPSKLLNPPTIPELVFPLAFISHVAEFHGLNSL